MGSQQPPMVGQQGGHMRPPPNKPTTYREYKRLKEEAEKRRREFEDKIRKEEEAKRKAEEKARLDAEELAKISREAVEVDETKSEQMEVQMEESKPEQVEVVEAKASEPQKKRESKDPRKRKVEEKERKDSSKKILEPVKETPKSNSEPIKAFKIPKVKKIENPEATPSKTVEPDVSKDPETKSKTQRDDLATKEVT